MALTPTTAGCYIDPIRVGASGLTSNMFYDTSTKELFSFTGSNVATGSLAVAANLGVGYADLASITLGVGTFFITGTLDFAFALNGTISNYSISISTTSNTLDKESANLINYGGITALNVGALQPFNLNVSRIVVLTTSTTFYLVAGYAGTGGPATASAGSGNTIKAVRIAY